MRKKLIYIIVFILGCVFNINVYALNEATLKNIQVNKKDCACDGFECSVEIDDTKATITYELADADAKVNRLSGFTVDLVAQGENKHSITVTNDKVDPKIENTYNITIKMHEKSSDISLSSLKVNGEDITLIEDSYVYSYVAKYDDDKLVIEAISHDSNATVKLQDAYDFPLDRSSISIDFEVVAEDKTVRTHRIFATRGARPNTYLKSLKLSSGNINFKNNVFEYDVQVEYNVVDLIIEAISEDDKANISIEKEDLKVGLNKITITVSNDKASSEYVLNVTREENLDKSMANLATIEVSEYPNLDFEENVLDYVLKFDNIPSRLTILAKSKSASGKVEILYNENLTDGSKIVIRNTLDDEKISREYSLTVVHNSQTESNKLVIIIALIGLVITMIVLAILEIVSRKSLIKKEIRKIKELKINKERKNKKEIKKKSKKDDIEII